MSLDGADVVALIAIKAVDPTSGTLEKLGAEAAVATLRVRAPVR